MECARRMERFGEGVFSRLAAMKAEAEKQGKVVYDFSIGAPNIPPAPHIRKALADACMEEGAFLYAISDTPALKEAVCAWYQRRYDVTLAPDQEVVSLSGSQEGLSHIALALINPGDTVLVPDPCYPVFADGPGIADAEIYYMQMKRERGYLIDLEAIPEEVARRARLMIVSYPNNPTCVTAPEAFYEKLVAFAKKYGIMVIHDNAYSELVFSGKQTRSFLSYPGAKEVGVEFNSLSKTYGLAGARIGFCVGNAEMVSAYKVLKSNMDYGMFLPLQKAAIAAITGDQSCVAETRAAYEHRAQVLCEAFGQIGWQIPMPAGTMFAWAQLPAGYENAEAFVEMLFKSTGVVVTPGSAFGPSGEGCVRFALVQDEAVIREAAEAIRASGVLAQEEVK